MVHMKIQKNWDRILEKNCYHNVFTMLKHRSLPTTRLKSNFNFNILYSLNKKRSHIFECEHMRFPFSCERQLVSGIRSNALQFRHLYSKITRLNCICKTLQIRTSSRVTIFPNNIFIINNIVSLLRHKQAL